jgi:hypothetical protein
MDGEKEELKQKLLEADGDKELLERRLYIRDVMSRPVETKKKGRTDKAACPEGGGTETAAGGPVQGAVRAGDAGVLKPDEVEGPDQPAAGTGGETGSEEVRRG